MSAKSSITNNRFYFVVIVTMVAMAALVIFVFQNVFGYMTRAYEVDIVVSDSELRVDKDKLEEAHMVISDKEPVKLEIR